MYWLAVSASFEYLYRGSTTIMNILFFLVRGSTFMSESDVLRRQILMSKVDPRAVRIDVVSPWHNLKFMYV